MIGDICSESQECALCNTPIVDSGGSLSTGLCLSHELQEAREGRKEVMFWKEMQGDIDVAPASLAEVKEIINGY